MARKRRNAKTADSLHMLIVESRFYDGISDELLRGATRVLEQAGARYDRITVPGTLEIPAAIAIAIDAARRRRAPYDGIVALGCVIRGETHHFNTVANESARALMDLAVSERLALGNGILTVENEAQAHARARAEEGDKGGAAARAALTMVALKQTLVWR
ncbi:MAG TPA: 6,7-dimethyl-8-ribityllumazine synthase [Pseudolabrys sp.]|jgi:6,7-dimethyl-8-ribityllumazine synthase|nr:6,7-dimethyl-8-ribityllumazine synthase [Pseudolabrys sp.]